MSDDGGSGIAFFLFFLGPGAGFGVWAWINMRYRNKQARYRPDQVVDHQVTRLDREDTFLKKTVSKSSTMTGRNESSHDTRAGRVETIER